MTTKPRSVTRTDRGETGSAPALTRGGIITYDPIGNITAIVDAAQQTVFFDNTAASPSMAYTYDAVYRLTTATGREHAGLIGDDQRDERDLPIHALPHANDMSAVRRYEETYEYDAIGNFVSLAHVAVGNSAATWTRRYDYYPGTNRLRSTSLPGDTTAPYSATYPHDAHGNITAMPHVAAIDWDPLDQMQRADLGGGGEVFFTYDAAGQRVRKYRKHIGALVEERIYLGSFELYRKRSGSTLQVERETLHVMDGVRRVAMIETKTVDTAVVGLVPTPRYRFQLGNHLETAHLEVDDTGLVISYEEMHPYGTSAYRSAASAVEVSARRYRYTGKERDDETGLDYFGARYYAGWLGRWVSADPLGVQAGINLYLYCRAGPVVLVDPDGTTDQQPQQVILKLDGSATLQDAPTESNEDLRRQAIQNYAEQSRPRTEAELLSQAAATYGSNAPLPEGDLLFQVTRSISETKQRSWAAGQEIEDAAIATGAARAATGFGSGAEVDAALATPGKAALTTANVAIGLLTAPLTALNAAAETAAGFVKDALVLGDENASIQAKGEAKGGIVVRGAQLLGTAFGARSLAAKGAAATIESGAGGGAGKTFFHGTDIESAGRLLGGSPLDAALATGKKIDGPPGFFLATHADDAAYFATRRGRGGVLEYRFSPAAVEHLGGLEPTPLGALGKFGRFEGGEVRIPTESFNLFNLLRQSGEIQVFPAGR